MICVGVIAGPIYDRGYFRYLDKIGGFLVVFGLMMLSISRSYWSIFLSQGLVIGLGAGCVYVPSIAILSTYFTTKRPLALCLAGSGSAVGGIIYPVIFSKLQPSAGFAWATRVIAFIALCTLLVAITIMTPLNKRPASAPRSYLDYSAFRDVPFLLYSIGVFFILLGYYVPVFYIPTYAETVVGTSRYLGFYLVAVFNAGSFLRTCHSLRHGRKNFATRYRRSYSSCDYCAQYVLDSDILVSWLCRFRRHLWFSLCHLHHVSVFSLDASLPS